jgi:hypothetical protein
MSVNSNYGYADTLTGTITVDLPALDYDVDYATVKSTSNEVIITNTTTSIDQPETIRFAIDDVSNIYNGSGIDPANYAPSKRGKKLLMADNLTLRVANGDGTVTDFPIQLGMTIKFPTSVNINDTALSDALHRVMSIVYDVSHDTPTSGKYAETLTRIKKLLRGSLNPIV